MSIAAWIVPNTLAAACLALIVTGACRWGRFSPAVRHGLWLVVLLKLVTPPLVDIPLPVPQWVLALAPLPSVEISEVVPDPGDLGKGDSDFVANDDRSVPLAASSGFESPDHSTADSQSAFIPDETQKFVYTGNTAFAGSSSDENTDSLEPLPGFDETSPATDRFSHVATLAREWWNRTTPIVWLAWGWCAGTAVFVLIQARRLVNLRRLIAGGRPAETTLENLVTQVAGELGVRPPPVRVVPRISSPALCAWGRVSLLWPEASLDRFSSAGRRAVVVHELAHLKRRDHWTGWVELLAGCGWWWNPLFWYVRHQLHENAELACDAWVVARLPDGRRAYAEALIDVAQGEPAMQLSGVVLGVGDGSRKLLERRLVMIMRGGVRYQIPVVGLAVIALVALATLPRWSIAHAYNNVVSEMASNPLVIAAAGIEESRPIDGPATFAFDSEAATESPLLVPDENVTGFEIPGIQGESITVVESQDVVFEANDVIGRSDEGSQPGNRFINLTTTAPVAKKESAGTDDNAARLSRVEAQLSSVLNELRELKKSRPSERTSAPRPAMTGVAPATGIIVHGPPAIVSMSGIAPASGQSGIPADGRFVLHQDGGGALNLVRTDDPAVETVSMIRTTYKLPKGRAEVLARSLADQLNDDIEIKVKGDSLQVTASHDDQKAIGHLILLIQRRGRTPINTIDADPFQ